MGNLSDYKIPDEIPERHLPKRQLAPKAPLMHRGILLQTIFRNSRRQNKIFCLEIISLSKLYGRSLYLSPSNGLIIARTIPLHDESLMICESHNGLSLMPINDLSIPRVWA